MVNDNLDATISALYKHLFLNYASITASDCGDIPLPDGWHNRPISEYNFDISDGNYSARYPKYDEFVLSGVPFIRGTDFSGKYISTENVLYITKEKHEELKKGHIKSGDILMSTRGEIGKIAFIPDTLIDANINSQLVRINANGVVSRVFLAYSLLSEPVKNEIKSLITGSAQEQLPIGRLQQLHILFPDKDTMSLFDAKANPLLNAILANEHEIVILRNALATILNTLSLSR